MARKGGTSAVNANSLEIENVARFAVDEHNRNENSALVFKKAVNAKTQVVAGTMYYITLEAKDGDKTKVYETEVLEKLMREGKELLEFKPVGEIRNVDANSLEIENVARFAVDEHNKKENSALKFKRVLDATKVDVVPGFMYYITLEAMDGDHTKVYQTKVWDKPSEERMEVLEFNLVIDAPAASSA